MVEFTAKDRAADAAYELATSPRDGLAGARDELNQIWSSGNLPAQDIGRALEDNNLLAPLALYDSAHLDTDSNGAFSYNELLSAATSPDSDTLTKTLAEHLSSEVAIRGYADLTISELSSRSGTMTDPIPGEMDFSPEAISDGQLDSGELAYADRNFDVLDRDDNDHVTDSEIDEHLSNNAGSISDADAAKLRDLSAQAGTLEGGHDDEWGIENDGFTRADLEVAATEMAAEMNEVAEEEEEEEEREGTEEDAVTADEILSGVASEEEATNDALATLSGADSSVEEQLAAIKTLVEGGKTTATIRDADGSELTIRMEVQPISEGSDRSYVQMFAVDENGRETVVLRALSDGDSFAQQRDANGNLVSYVGSRWQERHPDSVFGE